MALGENLHPMKPEKWCTRHLLAYAALHNISDHLSDKPQRGEVESRVLKELNSFYTKMDVTPNPVAPADVLTARPEDLLHRRVNSQCSVLFRQNPEKLQDIINAGLLELKETSLEELFTSKRLPSLEWWLISTVDDAVTTELAQQGKTRLCGRTLRSHEVIAYCIECAVDTQCVMCAECFQNSPCKNHKHILRDGSGNGMCDCGDPSAWKPESFCTRHRGFTSCDDPTIDMNMGLKRWLEVLFRGLVLYQCIIIRKFSMIAHNISDKKNGLEIRWIDRILRRTAAITLQLANSADCARRILCLYLMEKAFLSRPIKENLDNEESESKIFLSCVEEMFLYNIELIDFKDLIIWNNSILFILDSCLSDPFFRVPFAELLLKYGERLSLLKQPHVEKLVVQVFTVKDVVDALLRKTPHSHWKSIIGFDTILHRQLSTLLYVCSILHKDRERLPDSTYISQNCCHRLTGIISASENCKAMFASRLLFRAWCRVLGMIGSRSIIARIEPDNPKASDYIVSKDHAMSMEFELRRIFCFAENMIHSIALALKSGTEPIPNWLQETLLSLPSSWGPVPDTSIDYWYHRQVLDALSLNLSSPLLLNRNNNNNNSGLHKVYMQELLKESIESINYVLLEKRSAFTPVSFVLSAEDPKNQLPQYDLLDPNSFNPTSFIIPHMRFFAVLVRIWARLQQFNSNNTEEIEPFYFLISHVFEATQARADYWLDECLMPIVLLGQVEQGLWARDDCEVALRCAYYTEDTAMGLETDMYVLQLLLFIIPIENYSIQVLQRHMLKPAQGSSNLWYASFLRFILTLTVGECEGVINNENDLKRVLRRSLVHFIIMRPDCSFHHLEVEAEKFKNVLPDVDFEKIFSSVLSEVAISEQWRSKRIFRLKDASTWNSNVNMYHPVIRDNDLPILYDIYELLVRRERMAQRKRGEEEIAQTSHEPKVSFLPPNLKWIGDDDDDDEQKLTIHGAAMKYKVCLLLQTPAVTSVAIDVVHMYLYQNVKNKEKISNDSIGIITLSHAISILYLAMKSCKIISLTDSSTNIINWDFIETFQKQFMPSSFYLSEDLQRLFPVKGIMGATTLKNKLEIPIIPREEVKPLETHQPQPAITTIEALHQLCKHFKQNEEDIYSIVQMAEFILRGVGALSLSSSLNKNEEIIERNKQNEQEAQRRRRLKERQAALLNRVKSINSKSIASISNEMDNTVETNDNNNNSIKTVLSLNVDDTTQKGNDSNSIPSSFSVTAKILLRLAELECCMCRNQSNEPLLLFANTSTSDVLHRLRFDISDSNINTKKKLNGHIHLCGHAAHKKCVAKTFGRLANLWSRLFNELSRTTLSPSEFNCPICLMICTTLCPMPLLENHPSGVNLSLFEVIRDDTIKAIKEQKSVSLILPKFRQAIARASVGLPVSDSEDKAPLIKLTKIQENEPSLWGLLESLRIIQNQMYITLEWVKIGGTVKYNELLTLLSLMVSIDVNLLKNNIDKLLSELNEKEDSLSILILNILLNPREAVNLLKLYTQILIRNNVLSTINSTPVVNNDGKSDIQSGVLISIWLELGCLTLLKSVLTDAVPKEIVQCKGDNIIFNPLESDNLTTLKGQQEAVLNMLCYLLNYPFTSNNETESSIALASLLQLVLNEKNNLKIKTLGLSNLKLLNFNPLNIPYNGPKSWSRYIIHHLFHFSERIGDLLLSESFQGPCSVCGDTEGRRVMCCYCGKALCKSPSFGASELNEHALTCGNGLGVYFNAGDNYFIVVNTIHDRHLYHQGLYMDEYGQTGTREFRGHQVFISETAEKLWLSLWVQSRWGVESAVVKRTARGALLRNER